MGDYGDNRSYCHSTNSKSLIVLYCKNYHGWNLGRRTILAKVSAMSIFRKIRKAWGLVQF